MSRRAEDWERFIDKVGDTDANGCWPWLATVSNGYGRVWDGKRSVVAHRFSYEFFVGDIPPGLQIDHLCRNTNCVNPDHLEAVTLAENNRRSDSPTAINARKTHCIHGHEFAGRNLRYRKEGTRICRTCEAARCTARRAAEQPREDADGGGDEAE